MTSAQVPDDLRCGGAPLAFRSEDEIRSNDGDLLMRSPFDEDGSLSGG
jgi:hypothetical protein